jgi:hypothetical protein|tara:strand:- start:10808 stop:13036 length:2229 start_codon:yes stop_codon:yes gene_type:complete
MIPTNSSGTTNGCDSISSNCVIWQGPDISCIDLCNGDSISEVVFKLATKLCDLIESGVEANPNLTGLDLSCLDLPGTDPTEIVPVLQAMVVQICANADTTPVVQRFTTANMPIMTLQSCLEYNDANGNPVTELPLDEYATLIAQQVCRNVQEIIDIKAQIANITSRLTLIENCVFVGGVCQIGTSDEVQIIPTCVSTVGQLTDVSVVVLALESAFCALRDAVGTPALISNAVAQTIITGSTSMLSVEGATYNSIGGYNTSPSTLAQSVQNAWVVIDDMYNAIQSIQTNCCPGGCDSVIFGYTTAVRLDTVGVIEAINFDFTSSSIPTGFNDTSGRSLITLTDANGSSLSEVVNVASLQNNASGIQISTGSLNVFQDISITVDFVVSNGTDTCETRIASLSNGIIPCPTVLVGTVTGTEAELSFANNLGITAQYTLDLLQSSVVVQSHVFNNPGVGLSHNFTGLTPNTAYQARLTVVIDGATKVCPILVDVVTVAGAAPCTEGMDVAFVIDYTFSMSGIIDGVKSGVASLVSTIDTASGSNDYRLALITADERANPSPTYSSCVDYTNLPTSQRVANLGSGGNYQFITSWEQFGTNNGATFTTQLDKLNGGVDGTCVNLGDGNGLPEPTDYASQLVVGGAALSGTLRSNVAKYVIIITDALPGGTSDAFNATTWSGIQSMIAFANTNGIKYNVCGPGVNLSGVIPPVTDPIFPWRELATQTGGVWNASADASQISADIIAGCS